MNQETYNIIAKEFSRTRYKPWKCTIEFFNYIDEITRNQNDITILDLGCGNGKNIINNDYNNINYNRFNFIAIDNSIEFLKIVDDLKKPNIQTILSDMTELPLNDNIGDFMIVIASYHHLDSNEKRIKCLKEIERVVKKNGYILLTVWAMEQPESKVKKVKNIQFKSKDSIVPFYNRNDGKYYHRYYRIYSEFDFNNEIINTNLIIKKSYNENGNWVYWIENNKP